MHFAVFFILQSTDFIYIASFHCFGYVWYVLLSCLLTYLHSLWQQQTRGSAVARITFKFTHLKLVKQQYLLRMSLQSGELRPTIGWDPFVSLGHPCKFQRVSRLGSVTARHLVVGVCQTLRRWTEGATYVRQGDNHVGHWPTFQLLLSCCPVIDTQLC